MSTIPLGAVIGVSCGFGAILFIIIVIIIGVKLNNKAKKVWNEVAEKTGLLFEPATFPKLSGRIDGIEVTADVMLQQVSSGSGYSPRRRSWTRIRAQLPGKINFQVRSKHQKYGKPCEWPLHKTGDAEFDKKFELFAPEGVRLNEVFPAGVKAALLAAPQPVHVINNAAWWSQRRVCRNAETLETAIRSCAQVAAAVKDNM